MLCLSGALLFVAYSNYHILTSNRSRLYTDLNALPARDFALVLGCCATLRGGIANLYFVYRMDAAAALYQSGKVCRLLVSGDNRRADYDEPAMMKAALIARGVPATAITCDCAGFHTLDSVVRARKVFNLQAFIIVTQRYHNARALEMARAQGSNALGYCARDIPRCNSMLGELREIASRTLAMLDLYVWHRQPHFLGPRESPSF